MSEGPGEFVVYGPYWPLPAGHYEMIASIVPHLPSWDNNTVITGQVTGECGKRIFAAGECRLGEIQFGDGPEAGDIRVPFTLSDDLPAESRTIETRIYSPGNARFRIRSVAVKVRSQSERTRISRSGHVGFRIRSLIGAPLKPLRSLLALKRH